MEQKLLWGTKVGAVMNYFGSGFTAPEPKIFFIEIFCYTDVSLDDARINKN